MVAKFVVLVAALTVCHAAPYVITGENYAPSTYYSRDGRSPSFAYGFGSGFSSNIGGISHSSSIGSSFQSGDAQAYGAGLSGNNGGAYARGVGIANAAPSYYNSYNLQPAGYQQATAYNGGLGRNYGSAVSSAQNFGNSGSAVAQTNSGPQYGSAVSTASNLRGLGYGSAVSSATSSDGYGAAVSTANNSGYGNAVSSAQTRGGLGDYSTAVSAAENIGGYRASTAQTVQQHGGAVQQSGATSINAPGIQAAHSHAVNTGAYY